MNTYIAIDWGSTNLRGYFIENNTVINTYSSEKGVKNIVDKLEYTTILSIIIKTFSASENTPILLSGMVGGAAGWVDTAYVTCPFSINNTSKNIINIEQDIINNPVYMYPGLCIKNKEDDTYGVMRGEEIQLIGALKKEAYDLLILPGTHSKWVHVVNNDSIPIIDSFSTVMTGELYEVLLHNSLLGMVEDKKIFSLKGFQKGLQTAKDSDAIIASLFSTRAKLLLGGIDKTEVPAYLSGTLIGNEVKSQLAQITSDQKIGVVASKHLSELYKLAFQSFNLNNVNFLDVQEVTIQGYNTIAHDFTR
ncbi:2-dehydro-3-deoxygalactonokinase [Tenacibaculum aestuariivivum]|uniref:2-dehydro-3-deoxygalactonokinase n=1 Tax=Tenacibaculum aestuariivivum TaxID=2006131 RepID=UPI003AB4413B